MYPMTRRQRNELMVGEECVTDRSVVVVDVLAPRTLNEQRRSIVRTILGSIGEVPNLVQVTLEDVQWDSEPPIGVGPTSFQVGKQELSDTHNRLGFAQDLICLFARFDSCITDSNQCVQVCLIIHI